VDAKIKELANIVVGKKGKNRTGEIQGSTMQVNLVKEGHGPSVGGASRAKRVLRVGQKVWRGAIV